MTHTQEAAHYSRFQINIARFCGYFAVSRVAEYVGNKIHSPNTMDVPHGAVIALGLSLAFLGTFISDLSDREDHRTQE